MPLKHPVFPSDKNKTREQLIAELAETRDQLAANEEKCLELCHELARLKLAGGQQADRSSGCTRASLREAGGSLGDVGGTSAIPFECRLLVHQRELLDSLFDNIPVLLVMWDPRLQRFTLNRHAEETLGWSSAEANQGGFMRKVYPDPAYRRAVADYMQSLKSGWREWIVTTRSGEGIPIDWANIRLADDTMIGIGMDLRERKQAEAALRESEQRFRTVVENSRDGLHQLDLKKQSYVYMSPSQEEMTGFSAEELMLHRDAAARRVHPEDRPQVEQWLKRLMAGEDLKAPMEYRWRVKSGEYRWFSDVRSIICDDKGRPAALVGNTRDVTARKRTEAELRRVREELELRVRERTSELRRRAAQLSRLSSELTMAEQRERQRIARIMHDHLQQLMAAAKLRVEALTEYLENGHQKEARKIVDLIAETLAASRSLTMELSPPVLYQEGFAAALKWLAHWMKQTHGLHVDLKIRTEAGIGPEDIRVLIFQSVRELLFNVVKHAGVNQAEVEAGLIGGDILQITVSDQGAGFKPETIYHDDPVCRGFGLLSIQERLMLLGGYFQIDSGPGRGARFFMCVPRKADHPLRRGRFPAKPFRR